MANDVIAVLLERLVPESLDPFLQQVLGTCVDREGDGGLFQVCASGSFSGPQTADLLAFARSQDLNGALILTESDVQRAIYFKDGNVCGANSNVLFERLGRILQREGVVSAEDAIELITVEETQGVEAAAAMLPEEAARWGLERRVWDIAIALYFTRNAHFLIVEGTTQLGKVPLTEIPPTQLAMEGMRAYDEWRNGPPQEPSKQEEEHHEPPADPPDVGQPPVAPKSVEELVRSTQA